MLEVELIPVGVDDSEDAPPSDPGPPAASDHPHQDHVPGGPEATPQAGPSGRPSPGARLARLVRRHPWATALLAVLVGGGYAAVVVREAAAAEARRAELAALEQVALQMRTAPEELWRLDLATARYVAVLEGVILGLTDDPDEVIAVDAGTGRTRWTATFPGRPVGNEFGQICSTSDAGLYIGCTVETSDGSTVLAVVDPADGTVVAERTLPAPPAVVVATGQDLVLVLPVGEGRQEVRREDAVSGEVRWRHDLRGEGPVEVDPDIAGLAPQWSVRGGLLVTTGQLAVAVELGTGETLATWPGPSPLFGSALDRLPDGGWVLWLQTASESDRGAVLNADGSTRFALRGHPRQLMVDDRSVPDVVLDPVEGVLHAVDARTGTDRWTSGGTCGRGQVVLRLDGAIVCQEHTPEATVLEKVDLLTGDQVWLTRAVRTDRVPLITDGERVVLVQEVEGGRTAQAYSLDDGSAGWTMDLPEGASALWVLDHRLYTVADDAIVRLG